MRTPLLLVLAATLAFTGCGGGAGTTGGTNPPINNPGGGNSGGSTPQSQDENAINVTNALGTPMKSITEFNNAVSTQSVNIRVPQSTATALGTCNNGIEFFAPDKNGDPNSTQTQDFYDQACTQLARDTVRLYTINGTSENVTRTTSTYAINNATPISVRDETVSIASATFDQYGFPIPADGFDRSNVGTLNIAGSKTINGDDELVMLAASTGVNTFCADSAGFNATGVARLNETFGWQGGVLTGGTRTVNSDGSVTWAATHTGSTFKGVIGSLSIATGLANTACPITTPEFTLAGGTQGGSYTLPVSATYLHGLLENLTITNATLANGNSLNVTTSGSLPPTSSDFVTGIISNNGTQIATFNVDAFGDGTLTITSSGTQYVINDWHVVK